VIFHIVNNSLFNLLCQGGSEEVYDRVLTSNYTATLKENDGEKLVENFSSPSSDVKRKTFLTNINDFEDLFWSAV
jgi:hypothetical protein